MATPAGYIDPDDAHWELNNQTPSSFQIIVPFLCPPQAPHWSSGGSQSRQQISFNPFLHTSRTGVNYSTVTFTVRVGDADESATFGVSPGLNFEYEDFTVSTNFQDMKQAPDDDQEYLTEVYGPPPGSLTKRYHRMEYRDCHIKFAEETWHASDTDRLHYLMGAHFELEQNEAYANNDFENVGVQGAWMPIQEQRPISAWQMKNLLCDNINSIVYHQTPSFSMPLIGEPAQGPP
jgi:hypothetical protein